MSERKMNLYNVTVKFGEHTVVYPGVSASSKKSARVRVELDRQRKGDEMFIKSIKIERCEN